MKKFYAILLGLALVLGFASIASADFKITGQLVLNETYYVTNVDPLLVEQWVGKTSDTRVELTLSATYGNGSGDAKFRLKESGSVEFRVGKYFYKLSDSFKLGAIWDKKDTITYFEPLVDDEFVAGNLVMEDYDFFQIDDGIYLATEFAAGDLAGKAAVNVDALDTDIIAKGVFTYNMDPITISCGAYFERDGGTVLGLTYGLEENFFLLVPGVKYAISDEFSVAGELQYYYDGADGYIAIGGKAAYETDVFSVSGGFVYDLDFFEEIYKYFVEGSFNVSDAIEVYGEVTSWYWPEIFTGIDPMYEVGLIWTVDGKSKLTFKYASEFDWSDGALEYFTAELKIPF